MLILRPLIRFADFRGRARRAEYFGFTLAQGVLMGVMLLLAVLSLRSGLQGATGFLGWIMGAGLVALVCFIPTQALMVRRLHDSGKSTWFTALQLPSMMTPMVSAATVMQAVSEAKASGVMTPPDLTASLSGGMIFLTVASICNLILFVLMLLPGDAGSNRFGPNPRGGDGATAQQDRIGGMDEARLDSLIAEARAQSGSVARQTPVEALQESVFDFGSGAPEPAPARASEPEWRFRETDAPVFGRRAVRPA